MIALTFRSLLSACFMFAAVAVSAQLNSVFYEVQYADDGSMPGYPIGATTYRVYAAMEDPDDALTAVYGVGLNPLSLGAEGGMWNSMFGGITGPDINAAFFGLFPELAYDSMVTIGRESNASPGGAVTAISVLAGGDFETAFHTTGADSFGTELELYDGTWFSTPDQINTYGVGEDNRVLIAQITALNLPYYALNVQTLDGGIGGETWQYVWDAENVNPDENSYNGTLISEGGLAGCTDPTACNYWPYYFEDDGSCLYGEAGCVDPNSCQYNPNATCSIPCTDVFGCLDETACNYLENATCDVGVTCLYGQSGCTDPNSCQYDPDAVCSVPCTDIWGCTDPEACNYLISATCDDNNCEYGESGCSNPLACNYTPDIECASITNCIFPGCTDPSACNFNIQAGCDDGSCTGAVGCIDPIACNYNDQATCDNGTCVYPGCTDPNSCEYDPAAGCDDGSCSAGGACNNPEACNYVAGSSCDTGCLFPGCLDPEATNFDINADCEGECTYQGCTDATACNFNPLAEISDPGSCTYPGCTSLTACNFNPDAGCDDGSCTGQVDCNDPNACNYTPEPSGLCGEACFYPGCDDLTACNYQWDAGCNDGSCDYGTFIQLWFDQNANGLWEQVGFGAEGVFGSQGQWAIPALGVTLFADNEGRIDLPDGAPAGTYLLEYTDPAGVFAPTTPSQMVLELPLCTNKTIGVGSNGDVQAASQTPCCIWLWDIHCVLGFNPGLFVLNEGNVPLNGTVTITHDETMVADYLSGAIPYTSAEPGVVTWEINELSPGLGGTYQCHLDPPGGFELGDTYEISLNLTLVNNAGDVWYSETIVLNPQVVCSYDPNDKYAVPEGYAEPHFVAQEEEIEYRIRFQNTGNAAAIDVRIEDQLDVEHLDLDSFYPVFGSHDFTTCLEDDGKVTFKFNNIMLPDSASDEPGSQGYVVYRIRPLPDLPHGTEINNTAEIYFDINEPIITNTTWHTIMECEDFAQMEVGETPLCVNTELELNTGTPEYVEDYSWSWMGDPVSAEANTAYTPSEAGTFYLEHTVINPICNESIGQEVEVLELPTFTVSVDENCVGSASSATVDTEGTFQWEGLAEDEAWEQTLEASTTVGLTVTGANGCEDTQSVTLTPLPLPTGTFSIEGDLCAGETLTVSETTAGNTITWTDYGTDNPLELTLDASTTLDYTLVGDNGCESTGALDVEIGMLAAATFTQDGTLLTADDGVAWQWYFNGTLIPGATGQTYEATENGDYHVVVTSADGCDTTGDAVSITIISVEELELTALVYPNPVSEVAHVSFDQAIQGDWTLLDAQGKTVRTGRLNGTLLTIDMHALATGHYTLEFHSETHHARASLMVRR